MIEIRNRYRRNDQQKMEEVDGILESMHNCAQWPPRTVRRRTTAAMKSVAVAMDLIVPQEGNVRLLRS
jgi:hypothetical protein